MGREIRRVPTDWEHPIGDDGQYIPLYDRDYLQQAEEWLGEFDLWRAKTHESYSDEYPYYWEWEEPPNKEHYRPAFESEPTAYQIYENVTEGTPISPVFQTEEEMREWLIGKGYSLGAIDAFIERGFAFSMVVRDGNMATGIESAGLL